VIADRDTPPKGFGFVQMASESEAQAGAIGRSDGQDHAGRALTSMWPSPRKIAPAPVAAAVVVAAVVWWRRWWRQPWR